MFIEPYLGNVAIFAGNFAPRSWMFCQGQLLPISQYDALYALIGTTFGGDGQTTFALPNLQSRTAVHPGTGQGMSPIQLGKTGGAESVILTAANIGSHTHPLLTLTGTFGCSTADGDKNDPTGNVPAVTPNISTYNTAGGAATMIATNCTTTTPIARGTNQPIHTVSPLMAMNYVIAVEGIFPSRS